MIHWTKNILRRLDVLFRLGILLLVLGLAVFVPTTAVTLEYTAQPEFCNSCHIMDPYFDSWQASSHAGVSCIECHYEPGVLETVQGKMQALSQLAKYATRTQGTKPWAHVSDQSCLRGGCHGVRELEGEIAFGRVKFDHRPHLLDIRGGRRLRCTSCHSQVTQEQHIAVDETVCFTCHFSPEGAALGTAGECLKCHEAPTDAIHVGDTPFDHTEYVERGVECQECHSPSVKGEGGVRPERCKSCHGELEFLERYDETTFLHEIHITAHKVECFECHELIEHGLIEVAAPEPGEAEGCGACHDGTHGAAGQVYAGTGAAGVPDRPSRMYATRVVCDACHTGRANPASEEADPHNGLPHGAQGAQGERHAGATVAAAGEVDCIHCHGPGVHGMLANWQGTIGGEVARLSLLLAELETGESREEVDARVLRDARANLDLIERDGSQGAHNVPYVMDVLRSVANGIDAAQAQRDPEAPTAAVAGLPFVSEHGCTECHLGVEKAEALVVNARPFSHARHLFAAGLDCDACHDPQDHGAPAFSRESCASCHHQEVDDSDFDPWDCATCHGHQESYVAGTLEGFDEVPGAMIDKGCEECHGEPPDVAPPNTKLCALCHDEEYEPLTAEWRAGTEELVLRLERAIASARTEGRSPDALDQAHRALRAVASDGSRGAHNYALTEKLLTDALQSLE